MCGICGEVSRPGHTPPDHNIIGAITSRMTHRGPDEGAIFSHKNIVFGHRRLSIIDLEQSRQPMTSSDKRYALVFNGEIYNYVELKEELKSLGHKFLTHGDTEVLLNAYIEWKDNMLTKLNGMFSFAIYDFNENVLLAARDRFGQKPFVYSINDRTMIFSSELKPILLHPAIKRKVDIKCAADYLVFQNVLPPDTLIEGVHKLEAGTMIKYDAVRGTHEIKRYYEETIDPELASERPLTDKDIETCEEMIKASLRRHLRADVALGFYLSGGIDSTILTLLGREVLGESGINTFTVSHFDPAFDEGPLARKTSLFLRSNHFERKMLPGEYKDDIIDTLSCIDEPIADPGAIASYIVTKHAGKTVKVVISGNGGDEFFYGYEPYIRLGLTQKLSFTGNKAVNAALKKIISLFPDSFGYMGLSFKARIFLDGMAYPEYLRNTAWLAAFAPRTINKAMNLKSSGHAEDILAPRLNKIKDLYTAHSALSPIQRLSMDFERIYLPDSICSHTDKTSMMHSLEARSPFLDNELTDYANNLPPSWKFSGGRSKFILRKIIEKRLGNNEITMGKKRGFTIPVAKLLRTDIRKFAEKYFSREITEACGIFEPGFIATLWKEHQEGKKNHYRKLWTVFTLHHWIENNIKKT